MFRVTSKLLVPFSLIALIWGLAACGGKEEQPQGASSEAASPEAQTPAAEEDPAIEVEYWQSVKDTGDADQLLAYIKKYPEGQFVELAEARLKSSTQPSKSPDPLSDPNVAGPGASNVDPPAPPPAPTKSLPKKSRRESDRDSVLSVVRRSLGRYGDPRLHIYPDIPRFKAENAAALHGIDPRSILVLYDDGLSGGGKTGFCLTDRRVYWRFVSGVENYYLDYYDIQSAVARKNKFLLNGYEVPTTMSADSWRAAEEYADLMIDLRNAFR